MTTQQDQLLPLAEPRLDIVDVVDFDTDPEPGEHINIPLRRARDYIDMLWTRRLCHWPMLAARFGGQVPPVLTNRDAEAEARSLSATWQARRIFSGITRLAESLVDHMETDNICAEYQRWLAEDQEECPHGWLGLCERRPGIRDDLNNLRFLIRIRVPPCGMRAVRYDITVDSIPASDRAPLRLFPECDIRVEWLSPTSLSLAPCR